MNPLFSAKPERSWPFALALSLFLHLGLTVPFFFLSARSSSGENRGSLLIDTRVAAPALEVRLVLCERRQAEQPVARPAQMLAAVTRAAPSLVPIQEEGTTTAPTRQASPDYGTGEEQEAPAATRTTARAQGLGSADPGTGKDTTAFFQIATQGKAIVYVIDRSGSMGSDGCLAAAKRELLGSLEQLPSSVRFQVITYNRSALPLCIHGQSGLTFATAENKRCVARLLEQLHAEGGTDHVSALKQALALDPDVIFFLTDADDLRAEEVRKIAFLNHGRSVIHAIGLGRGCRVLQALAEENQGLYQSVRLDP